MFLLALNWWVKPEQENLRVILMISVPRNEETVVKKQNESKQFSGLARSLQLNKGRRQNRVSINSKHFAILRQFMWTRFRMLAVTTVTVLRHILKSKRGNKVIKLFFSQYSTAST